MYSVCVARRCTNLALGGTSYKTALCTPCKKKISNGAPLYLTCVICHEHIFIQNKSSGIRITCSEVCSKKRQALLNKEKYRIKHPIKTKQCRWCNKYFTKEQLSLSERKYCSEKCYHRERYIKNKQKIIDNNNE